MQKINFTLTGLTCVSCQKLSKIKLEKIDGVKKVRVELDGKTEIDSDREIKLEEIEKAVAETHYKILNSEIKSSPSVSIWECC
jgi:copper chaperone CopZ